MKVDKGADRGTASFILKKRSEGYCPKKFNKLATEIVVTLYCKRRVETFLSNFISSSLETRKSALPFIAVSITKLSSKSRQMLTSPSSKTFSDHSSISRRSCSISFLLIPYLSLILGRLSTSASSSSMASEISTTKRPFSKHFLNCAGKPKGLMIDDTQTFVSITTLVTTFFLSYFSYCLGNICFNLIIAILSCFAVYLFYNLIKAMLPIIGFNNSYHNLFVFFYINFFQRFKYAIFKNCIYYFGHGLCTFTFYNVKKLAYIWVSVKKRF